MLTALLIGGLRLLPLLLDLGPDAAQPTLQIAAEQFWWRARYDVDGERFEVANELYLPTGHRTAIALTSPDVVHSFWVPALAGKVDTIPGRTTHIALEPTREGTFRGACAEYCGQSHALMTLHVVTVSPEAYQQWIRDQAADAQRPVTPRQQAGAVAFARHGCPACHTIRGTRATGVIGPDLTHFGSRSHIAGILPNEDAALRRWLREVDVIKPEAHMPAFSMIENADIEAIAVYLRGLR